MGKSTRTKWPWSIANCSPLPGRIFHIPDPSSMAFRWSSSNFFGEKNGSETLKLFTGHGVIHGHLLTLMLGTSERHDSSKPMSTKIWIIHGCLFWGLLGDDSPDPDHSGDGKRPFFVGYTSRFIPKKNIPSVYI